MDLLLIFGLLLALSLLLLLLPLAVSQGAERRRRAEERARRWIEAARELRGLGGEYVPASALAAWRERWAELPPEPEVQRLPAPLRREYAEACRLVAEPEAWRQGHNAAFVEERLADCADFFERALGSPLNPSQRRACVLDEDNLLLLAPAGTGKTRLLEAKVAYLLQRGLARPEEILLLAFNRRVVEEVRGRLARLGLGGVEVRTFHALGLELLGRLGGRKHAVSKLALDDVERWGFLERQLQRELRDPRYARDLERWFVDLLLDRESLAALREEADRLRLERAYRRSLDGRLLRSQAEVRVANWLSLHGLRWEYERVYPHARPDGKHRDYTPDFYLPGPELWIEVWSVDREGRAPPTIDAARYRESMEWKRALHREHGTLLVEIYRDEVWSGSLSEILARRLGEHGVRFDPEPHLPAEPGEEGWASRFARLVDTFLQLQRAGNFEPGELPGRARSERDRTFLRLYLPLLAAYEAALQRERKVDFHDMLRQGLRLLQQSSWRPPWRYVLVDEAQDLSHLRLALLAALRERVPGSRLVLVGDDAQAIYRFAGADVALFREAGRWLGRFENDTRVEALDTTYRLRPDLLRASRRFVEKGRGQLAASLESARGPAAEPSISIRLHERDGEEGALEEVLAELERRMGEGERLLLLARYNHLLDALKENERFRAARRRLERRGVSLRLLTVHRAKGSEAEQVVVLGLVSGSYGFPSTLLDDPVLRMVLRGEPEPLEEERRLFYVALTRSRERVYLLGSETRPSPFVEELQGEEYREAVEVVGERSERYRCPLCHGRTIRRRLGRYGVFWACELYPACEGKLVACQRCEEGAYEPLLRGGRIAGFRCIRCGHEAEVCPRCGTGVLLRREGRYGPFLGCSNWRRSGPSCDYTRDLLPELDD